MAHEKVFEWREEYELGDTVIDAQHRQLLALANLLAEACTLQRDITVINQAFSALMQYTRTHFRDEEAFFEEVGAEDLASHHKQHVELSADLRRLQNGVAANVIDDPLDSLKDWVHEKLVPHMLHIDRFTYEHTQDPKSST